MEQYHSIKKGAGLLLAERNYEPKYCKKTESIFAQSNGFLGLRASLDLRTINEDRSLFMGGFYNKEPGQDCSDLVKLPDFTQMDLFINGEEILLDACSVLEYTRQIDLQTGELYCKYYLHPTACPAEQIGVESWRFVSKANPNLVCQKFTIKHLHGKEMTVKLDFGINATQTNSGVSHFKKVEGRVFRDNTMSVSSNIHDDMNVQILSYISKESQTKRNFKLQGRRLYCGDEFLLKRKETKTIYKYNLVKQDCNPSQQERVLDEIAGLASEGYDALFQHHKCIAEEQNRKSKIEIDGANLKEKTAIAFALYHLNSFTASDTDKYSIGAKGLSGSGYKGHVFWDTEIFLLPYYNYTFPNISKNLLKFRHNGLEFSRKKAEKFGYAGALFPWEASDGTCEETPKYGLINIHTGKATKVYSALKEHHISGDIAVAIWQYFELSNDVKFMKKYGNEILHEVANFWVSRAVFNEAEQKFIIMDVIGPDEYTEHIDNNAYTNYLARFCVEKAYTMKLYASDVEKKGWEAFLKKLYLPMPNNAGIIPQDDSFLTKTELEGISKYREADEKQTILRDFSREEVIDMQVLKQADLIMLFNLFPELFDKQTMKKNIEYYLKRTVHDSSLSYCAYSRACAKIGDIKQAYKLFNEAIAIDLNNNEKGSQDGIHSASIGGIWSSIVFGFAGLSIKDGKPILDPNMPRHWKTLSFSINVQGKQFDIVVENSKREEK